MIDQIYGSVIVFNFWHTKTNQLQPNNKSLLLPQLNHENKTKKTLHYKWEQPYKNLENIYAFLPRLSKSGSYVGSWEIGGIVNRKILHYLRKKQKNTHWYVK